LTEIGFLRFAAKEAVIKAHPQRNLTWHEITISHQASAHADRKGAPTAIIQDTNEDYEALISISHDGDYATAVCLGAGHTSQTDDRSGHEISTSPDWAAEFDQISDSRLSRKEG
ncbi:hypothetical protein diail_6043, partial [Diaporthe ilicicola]